jgi:hypothetical protein
MTKLNIKQGAVILGAIIEPAHEQGEVVVNVIEKNMLLVEKVGTKFFYVKQYPLLKLSLETGRFVEESSHLCPKYPKFLKCFISYKDIETYIYKCNMYYRLLRYMKTITFEKFCIEYVIDLFNKE